MHGRKQTVLRWIITAVIFTAGLVAASVSRADYGEWTWVGGSDTILQAGTYGIMGTPDAGNVPGARYGGAAWKDTAGDFWLFGGYGLDSTATKGLLSDLWRYDPDNGTWTWINGPDTILQAGIYGTKGTPDADNVPGARYSSAVWKDTAGDFWLFGGFGLDSTGAKQYLSDLWRYDPDNGTWTWMSGPDLAEQPGIYGTKGTPDADNVPGARYESAAWTDNATGNLWLFGGYGLDSEGDEYYMNDLWRFDPDNATWTWMGGSDRDSEDGTYGEKGIPDADNVPGARSGSFAWTDTADGDMWLFGGYGYDKNYQNYLSDLWRYDPDSGLWTWMSGFDKGGKSGRYGAQGMPAEDSVPGGRYTGAAWLDGAGDLWLFGGYGYPATGRHHPLNDLWRHDPGADLWTWISGSDSSEKPGIYGTKGMASSANVPGARNGSAAWTDSAGNLWLFGGQAFDSDKLEDYVNDLWRFELPADANMRIDSCSVKAGTTDSIKFAGFMDAGEARILAELGGEIIISLWTDTIPDPADTTFSFPINADTFSNGKYKSPKADSALKFSYDSAKGTMDFSAQNLDLTGLRCPITLTIEIGSYVVQRVLQEDIVNGTKPCPLPLMMGVLDSLDVSKFKAKKGSTADTDSCEVSGSFTVDGPFNFNTALPVDILLGPDTFSVPGGAFVVNKGVYSCKSVDTSNGIVTAKFDTVKCTYSIKVTKTTLSGSGLVDFSIDLFGYALQYPGQVALP